MPDLSVLGPWFVFLHVVGAFLFAAGHGVSVFVAFRIRSERDPVRLGALLDLSGSSLAAAGVGLLAILVTGVVLGIARGWFGQGWIWLSLVLFVLVGGAMTPLGGTYFRQIRRAIGQRAGLKADEPDPEAVGPDELERLLSTRRAELLALVGGAGFVAILYLMMFKPF